MTGDGVVPITSDRWLRVRRALDEAGDRFGRLLADASRTRAGVTPRWSVGDMAAHVASLARWYVALVDHGASPAGLARVTTLDTVDAFNDALLREFTERDPSAVARSLRADLDRLLGASAEPAMAVPWLGGAKVPLAGLLAHLLNELHIHGWDIARAARVPWVVPPEEAALFFDLFLLGVTHYGYGRLLDGHGPAPKGRVAVESASRHTVTRVMALTDGFATIEEPGAGPVDVRLSFEPVTLNLMLFGRVSKARAAVTGKVVVRGGRRPWTLPGFLRIVRLPS